MQNYWQFSSKNIYSSKCQRADDNKNSKEDEQTLKELNSAHYPAQAKCQVVQTNYMKQIKFFLCLPYNKHLINRATVSRSVWENLDLGRVYRPHCVRSVLTTSVKILPYRPPARLIRANYWPLVVFVQTSLHSGCTATTLGQYSPLLYGSVSQGLGTTKFANLIG